MFWAALFKSTFCNPSSLRLIDSGLQDDMIFIVGQSTWRFAKPYLRVFRRSSPSIPQINDSTVNWESTVYLNLITHCFIYVVTLGICTRSGAQEMEILKKKSLVVYASPSYRPMFSKGTQETIVYPHIVFPIDNFEDAFHGCDLRDSECLCVELTAYDQSGALQGVLFEGVVRYAVLKSAYDIDVYSRGSWRFSSVREGSETADGATDVSRGLPRTFVWMLARRSEGIAEVTIQQEVEDSGLLSGSEIKSNSFFSHLRRLSIPSKVSSEADEIVCPEKDNKWGLMRMRPNVAYRSANSSPLHTSLCHLEQRSCVSIVNLVPHRTPEVRGSKGIGASQIHKLVAGERGESRQCPFSTRVGPFGQYRKAISDGHNLNCSLERFRPLKKCIEIDSSTFEDEFNDQPFLTVPPTESEVDASVEKQATFGQAWQWFKERRRITSTPLKAGVTYVSLPWYLIISDIFDAKKTPVLTSTFVETLAKMGPLHEPGL